MSDRASRDHFQRIRPLIDFERAFCKRIARGGDFLPRAEADLYRYATNLARVGRIDGRGVAVDLFESVAPFRHWFLENIVRSFSAPSGGRGDIDIRLRTKAREVERRVADVRRHIVQAHGDRISPERLDEELRRKQVVLVLGGGGGAGYAHLGVFALLSELGVAPSMIVGSSMGSVMGLLRAARQDYDPMLSAVVLPRPIDYPTVFWPYRGYSRFGFPGAFELRIKDLAEEIFHRMLGRDVPRFGELPIKLRAVAAGLRDGIDIALSSVEAEIGKARGSTTPFAVRRRVRLSFRVARQLMRRPQFLTPVVFGQDPGIRDFGVIEAVGFSCSVPGLLHYDLFRERNPGIGMLQRLFRERGLLRLTDGGVVSNVASRVAFRAVQAGELDSRNALILAFDPFAPLANRNFLYFPVQQMIARQVRSERKYSDFHYTYPRPPSPLKLLLGLDAVHETIERIREEIEPIKPYVREASRTLPRWEELERRVESTRRTRPIT